MPERMAADASPVQRHGKQKQRKRRAAACAGALQTVSASPPCGGNGNLRPPFSLPRMLMKKPDLSALKSIFLPAGAWLRRTAVRAYDAAPGMMLPILHRSRTLWHRFLALPASKRSLRLRLSVFFSLFMVTAWAAAALFAWLACREYIDEFFDSRQMLVARLLATADLSFSGSDMPKMKEMLPGVDKHAFGDVEEEAISLAVYSPDGKALLNHGEAGQRFPFEPVRRGFVDMPLLGHGETWRIVWMNSVNGRYVVAVGQELDYRTDMALEMLEEQIMPWLLLLPVLLAGLFLLLTRELAPLRDMAAALHTRMPEENTPLDTSRLPSEVLPMAEALNDFFARTEGMLQRERAFISDAAHELRTPLAGLRIQAQVAAQPGIDEATRRESLAFLRQGIDRCARLMEQILALSRLEAQSLSGNGDTLPRSRVGWAALLEEMLPLYRTKLEQRGIVLESNIATLNASVQGNSALLSMLLRNILENAASYTPDGGLVRITLEHERLVVQNDCRPLPEEYAARLGERFFRPPGQEKTGSGLGLSIMTRIAALHGFRLEKGIRKDAPGFSPSSFLISLSW